MKKLSLLLLLFTGIVNAQITLITPTDYELCNQNGFGILDFDLTTKDEEILGILPSNEYVVSYHSSLEDSENNVNIIDIAYAEFGFPTTVYVRVQSINSSIDFGLTTLTLVVNNSPFVSTAALPDLVVNETQFDGEATFDLTTNQALVLSGQSGVNVSYHNSLSDAQTLSNPIATPTSFIGTHLQTIWIVLQDGLNGCSTFTSFQLKVYDLNDIVIIPDANFKARLLNESLNSAFITLPSGLSEFVPVDANGDNEIQASEAALINGLNISNANISDLTGMESFVNLTDFIGNLNPISNINLISTLTNLRYIQCIQCSLTSLDVSTLANLGLLDCTVNQLTSLNITGLSNLVEVRCDFNQLTSLALSPSETFKNLSCTNNLLTSLNTSVLPNLETLYSTENQLTTLDVSSNLNLQRLSCGSQGTFTGIDLSNLSNLIDLTINKSLQTTIDLSSNNLLQSIEVKNTAIAAIDISNTQVINGFIGYNPNLEYLNLKNGINTSNPGINSCPSLVYVCANEEEIIFTYNNLVNPLYNNNPNVQVNSYCSFVPGGSYNTITGRITYDGDNNGCDSNDAIMPNHKVKIFDGVNTGYTFTNQQGIYSFYTLLGNFEITPSQENSSLFSTSPSSANVNFSSSNNIDTNDFCVAAIGIINDLEVVISPINQAIPGFDAVYNIVYRNKGNQTLSGNVSFTFNDLLADYITASVAPTTVSDGVINWNYSNLMPFESRNYFVTLNLNNTTDIPALNIGDILNFSATVNPTLGDNTILDNSFEFTEAVLGDFNPINIVCLEGENAPLSAIGSYFHYAVNFENTGLLPVENIVVKLDIDANKFDINSLQIQNSNDQVYARINGNRVEFIFENINLERNAINPPVGGHGDVLFKIKTKSDLVVGDIIMNTASIYFDYNAPILTNEAVTTFATLSNAGFEFDSSISVHPNPANATININANSNIKILELYDMQGRILQAILGNSKVLNISDKANGIYFLKIISEKGSKVEKIIKE